MNGIKLQQDIDPVCLAQQPDYFFALSEVEKHVC